MAAADYRTLALEHAHDDLFGVAAQSAAFREMTKITLAMVAERDKRIASLQRQLDAVKNEYQAHRERTMRASLETATSEPVTSTPHAYTTRARSMPPSRSQRRREWRPPQGVS